MPEAKPLPESGSSEPVEPAVDEAPPSEPSSDPVSVEEGVPSEVESAPQSTTEVATAEGSIDTEPAAAQPEAAAVVEQEAVETALVPAVEAVRAPVEEVAAPPPAAEETAPRPAPVEEAVPPAPTEEESVIVIVTDGKPTFAPDPKLGVLGQASPEDEDLYSTRG
ncbi:hypothetical protein J4Q44_G00070170 [Coregonus suidteri]|uniref:Uncharacterized protein n=1 Tax=Coregonus suidteri TaxID=861788 RepID=A0AAN8MEI7_9TELE